MTLPSDPFDAQGSLFGPRDFREGADPAVAQLLETANCPYQPGSRIGEGAMARVYFGTHRVTGRPVAIKIPKDGPWATERFWREVDAMDRLDHPHVMPLLEADRERRWYAMPWAQHSLSELRRRSPSARAKLGKVLSSVAGAMMHAHANGCIHRDASPDNVLLLQNGHWVLADFGIAMLCGSSSRGTRSGQHFGTPDFSAPEVYLDPKNATPAADAWSLGALASWYTSIAPGQRPTTEAGIWWLTLIENTVRRNPRERWSISTIAAYLGSMPVHQPRVLVAYETADLCPHCEAGVEVDGAGRCRRCGFMGEE
jgi:serine/threonine protein kinase